MTRFTQEAWNLTEFNVIGYDKSEKRLCIYFLSGDTLEVFGVEEHTVFDFIIRLDKEDMVHEVFMKTYSTRVSSTHAIPLHA